MSSDCYPFTGDGGIFVTVVAVLLVLGVVVGAVTVKRKLIFGREGLDPSLGNTDLL